MNFTRKRYESTDDYWKLRGFFRDLRAEEPRSGANWHVCDFDDWRWHFMENVRERPLEELTYWQTADGRRTSGRRSHPGGAGRLPSDGRSSPARRRVAS